MRSWLRRRKDPTHESHEMAMAALSVLENLQDPKHRKSCLASFDADTEKKLDWVSKFLESCQNVEEHVAGSSKGIRQRPNL
eukprot:952801-Pyramimonas_sp.AAC.1